MASSSTPIYLDYNATCPLSPAVVASLSSCVESSDQFGNPSSAHVYGRNANRLVSSARQQVANLLHCSSGEVVFVSGGSEACNMAIKGVAFTALHSGRGKHIVTSQVEHPAVVKVCQWLETALGFKVTYLPVDEDCRVSIDDLRAAVTSETCLVSVMHANNEVGTLQDIAALSAAAKQCNPNVVFHSDASQSVGKVAVDLTGALPNVDLLTVAGHKLYAPKGIGALFVRQGTELTPLMHGASQEGGLRAGTENFLIAALGVACDDALKNFATTTAHLESTRNFLLDLLVSRFSKHDDIAFRVNGHKQHRLPNTISISIRGVVGGQIVAALQDRVCIGSGSACHSGCAPRMSSVLSAMHVPEKFGLGTLRISVGKMTTTDDAVAAADAICQVIVDAL